MSQLKRLFQLASAVVAIGLCLTPTSAHAVKLTILGEEIAEIPEPTGTICFPDCAALTNKNNKGILKSNFFFKGKVTAEKKIFTTLKGVKVPGAVLTLTQFTLINNLNTTRNPSSLIKFENNFGDVITSDRTGQGLFSGSFIDSRGVDTTDTATFRISFETNSPEKSFEIKSSSPTDNRATNFAFSEPKPLPVSRSEVNSKTTVGQITSLNIGANEQLTLMKSACIVVVDGDITENDAKRICKRVAGVPEPSFILSLFALGALGATSLLTCKQKVSQLSKD